MMTEDKSEKTAQLVPASSSLPAQPLQQTQKDIETERIDQWRERAKKTTSSLTFKPRATEGETGTRTVTLSYGAAGKEPVGSEVIESTLCATYGSANSDYALKLLTQALPGFFLRNSGESVAQVANAISGALLSLNPKDEIEGMLCTRLLVLHNQYMDFLGRVTNPEQTDVGIDSNINNVSSEFQRNSIC